MFRKIFPRFCPYTDCMDGTAWPDQHTKRRARGCHPGAPPHPAQHASGTERRLEMTEMTPLQQKLVAEVSGLKCVVGLMLRRLSQEHEDPEGYVFTITSALRQDPDDGSPEDRAANELYEALADFLENAALR
jgi:hypothetical protein